MIKASKSKLYINGNCIPNVDVVAFPTVNTSAITELFRRNEEEVERIIEEIMKNRRPPNEDMLYLYYHYKCEK